MLNIFSGANLPYVYPFWLRVCLSSCPFFKISCFVSLPLSFESSYTFWIQVFHQISGLKNISFQFVACVVILFSVFHKEKILIWSNPLISFFLLWIGVLLLCLWALCLISGHEEFLLFSSKSFIVPHLKV